jgi:hypothetical protein
MLAKIEISKNNLEVVQKENFQIEKLTESENEIVRATQGKRISELTENELKILAGELIFTAKARLGNKQSEKYELIAEITLILNDLRGFKGLTSTELSLALKSGLNGEFLKENQTVFWSSANFVFWVKKWISEKKQPVMKQYTAIEQANERVKPPPTVQEYKDLIIQVANQYALEKIKNDSKRQVWLNEIERCKKEMLIESDILKKRVFQTQINLVQIDLKKHQNFEVQFASTLYEDLERFEIWKMPPEDKKNLFQELTKKYKKFTFAELKKLAQNSAYNVFISMLVTENKVLNKEGLIVLKSNSA